MESLVGRKSIFLLQMGVDIIGEIRDLGHFLLGPLYREFQDSFEYKMSSIAHVFWTVKRNKRNHKKFLLKNFFPKNNKEKNFVNNSGAHDPMHAFSKYSLTICASSYL